MSGGQNKQEKKPIILPVKGCQSQSCLKTRLRLSFEEKINLYNLNGLNGILLKTTQKRENTKAVFWTPRTRCLLNV